MFELSDSRGSGHSQRRTYTVLVGVTLWALLIASPQSTAGVGTPASATSGSQTKLIHVNTYHFDPLVGVPDLPRDLRYHGLPPDEGVAHIVQFKTRITGSMKRELEDLGAQVLGYIPEDACLVEASPRQIDRVRALPAVRWAGLLEPAYKLSPNLAVEFDKNISQAIERHRRGNETAGGDPGMPVDTSKIVPVALKVHGADGERDITRFLKANGASEVVASQHGTGAVGGKVPRQLLARLAHQPALLWIERKSPDFLLNDRAAWTVQSNNPVSREQTAHDNELTGLGQTITIADSGIDWDHSAFADPAGIGTHTPPGAGHRKVTAYYVPANVLGDCHENQPYVGPNPGANPSIQHGTHVAGTAAGDDATWGVFDGDGLYNPDSVENVTPHDGMAYRAQLQFQDIGTNTGLHSPNDNHDLFRPAVDPAARILDPNHPYCPPVTPLAASSFIHSNSWGEWVDASYINKSLQIDDFLWDPDEMPPGSGEHRNQDLFVLFAAGNNGVNGAYTIGAQGVAKNSLTVGASGNADQSNNFATNPLNEIEEFSSRGPACDGRIKPDVMAPGRSLWSAVGCDHELPNGTCAGNGLACDTSDDCANEVCEGVVRICSGTQNPCQTTGDCQVGQTCITVEPGACQGSGNGCNNSQQCPPQQCTNYPVPITDCTTYRRVSGTSMATPLTAGAAALVRQYYMDGFYPSGAANASDAETPSAALIKATLINGAVEMTGSGAYANGEEFYPNNQQGWGRVHLDESLYFQGEPQVLKVYDERVGVTTEQTMSFSVDVTPSCGPLKATLVWTDAPAGAPIPCDPNDITIVTAPTLVNNLDLVVRSPQGAVYRGNNYTETNPAYSVADPNAPADDRNNVEGVLVIPGLTQGTWTVEVTGQNIPMGYPDAADPNIERQPFALVINCGDPDNDDDGDVDWDDCGPDDPSRHSGAVVEICDGFDQDCDGAVDEGFPNLDGDTKADCVDLDDDNDGDADTTDCAPLDQAVRHGATEVCNGVDDNCTGVADEGFPDFDGDGLMDCVDPDKDGDGVSFPQDCADLNPAIPAEEDIAHLPACSDSIDNDCDQVIDLDCATNATSYLPLLSTQVSGPLSNIYATSSPNNVYQTLTEGGGGTSKRLKVLYSFPGVNNLNYILAFEGFKNNTAEVFSVSYANSATCGTDEVYNTTIMSVSKIGSDADTLQTTGVGTVTPGRPLLCIKLEDAGSDNQADTVTIDRLYLKPADTVNCTDTDADGYTASCSGCFNSNCPAPDCDDADALESPGLVEGPVGNATCSDSKDNDCDGQVDLDEHEQCLVQPPDVLANGEIAGTGTVTGTYTLTQTSNDAWQSLKEVKVSNKSKLVHTWYFDNVPSGYAHKLHIEAQRLEAGDDNFVFYYSTDNVVYNAITGATITQAFTDQVLEPAFGSGSLNGRIYIQVRDSDPNNSGSQLNTVKVDRLAIKTVP